MRRRLDRLFTFARAAENSPLENFTTEALAEAVELDPGPLLRALPREVADVAVFLEARIGRVDTQVRVPGGIVDLVVELVVDGAPLHLWIEVKAHAGLSGDQLHAYVAAAKRWPSAPPPIVFMLCKYPLTRDVPTLRWNTLRACVTADSHHYWLELRDFLENQRMADDFDTPFSGAQLGAAAHARALLCKAARLAHEFLDRPDRAAYDAIAALAPGLPTGWTADWNRVSPWIGASQEIVGDLEHETAMAWLLARVHELEAAKILVALPKWRRHERLGDDNETD